jgi:hypothetical protein
LRSAQAVRGDVRGTRGGNEGFVTEAFAGKLGAGVSDDNLFKFGEAVADSEDFLQLRVAGNENDFRAAVLQDVGHAVGRFVEINRDGDAAGTGDGKVGGVPFGTIGGEKADAIAGLHAEFDEGGRKARDATKKFLGRDGIPAAVAAEHLRARARQRVDGIQEARGKSTVVHGLGSLYPTEFFSAMRRQAGVLCGTLRVFSARLRGAGRLRIAAQGKFVTPLAKASDEALEHRFAFGLRFFCSLPGHGSLAGEDQLREVGESDGIATRDALASELPDEIAEEEIHFIGGGEAVDVSEKLGGEHFRIHGGNSRFEAIGVIAAERSRSSVGGMVLVDQHMAAVAAGVLVLALMDRVLFWGHDLAFRKIEVTTGRSNEVKTDGNRKR